MFTLKHAILLCLLLAAGATTASCLIPQLTIAGIWGIPVLGFALLVAAIFRCAVYYDPREPQTEQTRKSAGYVASGLLCYLLVWSSLDHIFQKGQHVAALVGSTLGCLTILCALTLAEFLWVTKQTPGMVFPSIFELKRVIFPCISTLYLLACLFRDMEGIKTGVKPIVIFFAYANCVSFAAVFCGVYREQRVFASNGTIAERLATWLRSKIEPGELLSTLQSVFTIVFYIMLILQSASVTPTKNSPIFKGLFAGIAAISCYIATRYDPRKPPETSNLARRVIAVSFYLTTAIYFEWYVKKINDQTNPWNIEVHSVTMMALIAIRAIIFIWFISGEMSLDMMRQKILMIFWHILIYSMSSMGYVLITILNLSFLWQIIAFTVSSVWYYYTSLFIILVIAGKYREVVRQVPPPPLEQQFEVVVDVNQNNSAAESNFVNV
jgi:hypothetical protein